MSFTDALTRISTIQSQISALGSGPTVTSRTPAATTAGTARVADAAGIGGLVGTTGAAGTGAGSGAASFAAALAVAQGATASGPGALAGAGPSALTSLLGPSTAATPGLSRAGELVGAGPGIATGGRGLPAGAAAQLTTGQQQFASSLVAQTGLDPTVVSAWLLAEESGSAAQGRQAAGNHDWLNIGYTDSGTVGAQDAIWRDPVSAATATAGWLRGQPTIPGYGTASPGVQSILAAVGQGPAAQVAALQHSGWASSGYPDLNRLVAEVGA